MIVLGRIVAAYGIKGWVRVRPFGDDPQAWCDMPQWWLGCAPDGTEWTPGVPTAVRFQGHDLVAKLAGIDDRNAAERLDGLYVAAPREALPATAEQEYYWADLVGLDVVNEQDEALGRIDSLLETGANAVLVVKDGEEQRLLPFVAQVVKSVDVEARQVRVAWGKDW